MSIVLPFPGVTVARREPARVAPPVWLPLLAVIGAAGLLLGYAVIAFFQQGPPLVSDIGVRLVFRFDRRVVVIGLTLAFACALAASLLPAWRASRASDLVGALRAGTGARGGRRLWGPNVLVAAQLALALTVLAGAAAGAPAHPTAASPARRRSNGTPPAGPSPPAPDDGEPPAAAAPPPPASLAAPDPPPGRPAPPRGRRARRRRAAPPRE